MKRFVLLSLLLCTLAGVVCAQDGPPNIKPIPNAPTITIPTTDLKIGILDLKQNTTFAGTDGTAWNWQVIFLDIGATEVYTLTWNPAMFKEIYGKFPKKTVVLPERLLIGIKYNVLTNTWEIVSTNEPVTFQCQTCPPK